MVSHQDKIKPQYPHLSSNNLIHQILKELSHKYLGPKAFLSLQQKTLEISYQVSNKQFKPKSFCNKYFGKKILYVTDSRSLNQAIHSCKLFQRVKFDKNVCSKEGFKAKGDLILIGKDTHIEMDQITKAVRGCKEKVSIVLNWNIYQYTRREMYQRRSKENPVVLNYSLWLKKWLRNCSVELQSLSLIFQSIDQLPTWKHSLRNLRHFSLKFDQKFAKKCGWKYYVDLEYIFEDFKHKYFTFLLEIIEDGKKLRTVRIDLAPYSMTSMPLAYLLLVLNYYKISDWYVRIGTFSEDFMKIVNGVNIEEINKMAPKGRKSTSEVLERVDFLGIYVVNYLESIWDEFAYDKYEDYGAFRMSVPRLGELPEVTCKYKRIFDVTLADFSLEKPSINLRRVLSHFPGLEGLYLKVVENVVIFEENDEDFQQKDKKVFYGNKEEESEKTIQKSKEDPDEFKWTRNLRKVFITFLALTGTNELDFESETQSFSKLMEVLKTRCPHLISLNIFRGHPVYDSDGQVTICAKVPLNVPCEEITGMSSLRELEVTADNRGLKSIGNVLATLKNLMKLKINIVNNDFHLTLFDFLVERDWERHFYKFDEKEKILYHVPGLKELELIVNKSGNSIKWAEHFAKYMGSFKSLEVLKVSDLNQDEIRLEVLMKIVDGLSRKRTLKRVEIDTVIVQDDSTLEFVAGLMNNLSKGDVENLVSKSLQAKIVQMIELNPKLELVDIHLFKEMKIERILYDTRPKVL